MKEQEGPYLGLNPATYFTTCSGCKYHEQTLCKSGNNPIYRHDCNHEIAPPKPMKLSFTGFRHVKQLWRLL